MREKERVRVSQIQTHSNVDDRSAYDTDMWEAFEASRSNDSPVPVPLAGALWSSSSNVQQVRSPYDGRIVGHVPMCDSSDVSRAVDSARGALNRGLPAWKRAEILDKAAVSLSNHRERFASLISDESCKPVRTARVEVDRAISTFQFSAAQARSLSGEVVPMDASQSGEGRLGFTIRVPIGVIAAITPFNFPLNLVVHKVGPAIAAGCPVVIKPASQTPMTSVALARVLIEECGLPRDWIHVAVGPGQAVGGALIDHPGISMVTFTGSPDVGWSIRSAAPKKKIGLELGNNAPVIIAADGDWQSAARKIRVAGFSHAGQSCISTQRIYVHSSIRSEFVDLLISEIGRIKLGDPRDDDTEVSSLISHAERDRVVSWITEAVSGGAKILCGGDVRSDGVLEPTVLTDVTRDMKVCAGEIFGPVVVVFGFDDLADAFDGANDSVFGLQAGIFTASVSNALAAMKELDYGGVVVNDVPTYRADQQPYGGVRESGNTREGPAYSTLDMTEIRTVIINP